jgi:hypothetical protein
MKESRITGDLFLFLLDNEGTIWVYNLEKYIEAYEQKQPLKVEPYEFLVKQYGPADNPKRRLVQTGPGFSDIETIFEKYSSEIKGNQPIKVKLSSDTELPTSIRFPSQSWEDF